MSMPGAPGTQGNQTLALELALALELDWDLDSSVFRFFFPFLPSLPSLPPWLGL